MLRLCSSWIWCSIYSSVSFFFQAEDGIRDLVRSRGLGDVYKRQPMDDRPWGAVEGAVVEAAAAGVAEAHVGNAAVDLSLIHI